jgi:hypothetical protein
MPEWLTFSVVKDTFLLLLGLYGAGLSTFNYRHAKRKERRTVEVELSSAVPVYEEGPSGAPFVQITATNVGHRAVTITTVAIELPGGKRLFPTVSRDFHGATNTRLPASLTDGQSVSYFLRYEDVGIDLLKHGFKNRKTKIVPLCVNSVGDVYRGKPWVIDPEEWART